ncbi:MAG: hypothetical protein KC493_14100 [Bacteriovoracaceae bacterium]|nr:hypothetical protein [Bacteriovoracaceae bacterium]
MDKIQRRSRVFFSLSILLMTSLVYQNCDVLETEDLLALIKGKNESREVASLAQSSDTPSLSTEIQSSVTLSNSNPSYKVEQILEVEPPLHIIVNNFEKLGSGTLFIQFDQVNCSYHFDKSLDRRHFFKLENCREEDGELLDLFESPSFYIEKMVKLKINGSFGGGIVSTSIKVLNLQ